MLRRPAAPHAHPLTAYSGLSGPRFAALHGVNYQTLVSWLKKRRQDDAEHPALRSLVPAELDRSSPRHADALPMEILLPCGVRLAVHTSSQMNMAAALELLNYERQKQSKTHLRLC